MLDRPAEAPGASAAPQQRRQETTPPGLGVRMILTILRRRKWPLLGCMILVPLAAFIALQQVTPRYTASGTLIYEPSEYRVRELQSILRADPTTEAVMASQAEILHSLRIAQRVAERGNLFDRPEFNRALRPPGVVHEWMQVIRWLLGMEYEETVERLPGPRPDAERNATLVAVREALHANPVRFSRIIEVTFIAEDPLVAAAAVNNAMDVYIKDQFAAKARLVHRATDLLEKRAAELRIEVKYNEDAIAAYRSGHALSQGMHAGLDAEQITHLTEDLVRARGELANADARLDAARGRAGAAAQAAIAVSVVQLRNQQGQLAGQLQAQQARLGANHPEAESLRRQMAELQRHIDAEIARVVAATGADRRAAVERVAALEQNLTIARAEADHNAQAQVPLNALVRDAEAARAQLQAVLERIQQTAQQAAVETPEAHEISQALPPARPSWPRTAPMMAASSVCGLFLGLMLVYLLHLADATMNSGDDVRSATGIPCFALLPEVGRRALGHIHIEDYVARRPLTAYAEQIRALRAGLWLGANRPRIIAITAARPAEGKTSLTLSFARSAYLAGERVIAIDCDLRRGSFARRVGNRDARGLSDVLLGEAALEDVIHKDPLTGMDFITSGRPGGDLVGLFLSEAMARVLNEVRQDYDLVLLDASPVQAMTEARVVAAIADATLMCVRWRSTPRDVVQHALELMEEAHANVVGTVLTRVDSRAHVRSGSADAEVYHPRYKTYYEG